MPKLSVVESGICTVWRGFRRVVERFVGFGMGAGLGGLLVLVCGSGLHPRCRALCALGGRGIGSVAPRAGAGLNTAVRQPPPDFVLIAGWHIRRRWLVIDRCWPIIDRRSVIPGRGEQRTEKNGAANDPCGYQQVATMAIVMPAVAIVIATRLDRGAGQHEDDAQKAGGQGFLHVMALSANRLRQRIGA